jgi:pyridoxal phosphate enzyme (YggS family)
MPNTSQSISQRLQTVNQRINDSALACGRDPAAITLLAVSKTRPSEDIRAALATGQVHFGENYLQDALVKIQTLRDEPIIWHFIGPIQSNKTRSIAQHFDWVHSVDRLKIARRLSEQRLPEQPPLQLCLQVNISREASKSGFLPENVAAAAREIAGLANITLRGLMGIPEASADTELQRLPFAQLRELQQAIRHEHDNFDTLSMGMSGDLEAAIQEGATLVRIGTDIFGPRQAN